MAREIGPAPSCSPNRTHHTRARTVVKADRPCGVTPNTTRDVRSRVTSSSMLRGRRCGTARDGPRQQHVAVDERGVQIRSGIEWSFGTTSVQGPEVGRAPGIVVGPQCKLRMSAQLPCATLGLTAVKEWKATQEDFNGWRTVFQWDQFRRVAVYVCWVFERAFRQASVQFAAARGACRALGVREIIHGLRHSAATILLNHMD